jgi:APA family basic amino acid/polyamine antiporter
MEVGFQRTIGLRTATALVVGSIVGSGIFMRPAEMAALLGSPLQVMLVWIVAGLFTLLSVLVMAEVAAMLPETGGQYAFMQHMYGDFWAYLYGWAAFAVINCAGTAGISFIAAQYLEFFIPLPRFDRETEQAFSLHIPFIGKLFPLEHAGRKTLSILFLTVFTMIGYRSTKLGARVQFILAAAKVLAISLLVGGLLFSGKGNVSNLVAGGSGVATGGTVALVLAWVAACNGALQALDGCNTMLYMTGEIRNPGVNIPRSLVLGLLTAIGVYLAVNLAMMYVLPMEQMAGSALVASDAAMVAFGAVGGGIIAFLIVLSVLGSTQVNVLTPPRLSFAMAQSGRFFRAAGVVHPRFHTPGNALLIHLFVMVAMTLSGSFYILTDMYIFITWVFNLMMMSGLFILRRKYPEKARPYKVWGYPWLPMLVIAFNAFYLVVTLYDDIRNYLNGKTPVMNSVFGLVVVALGIPLYLYFRKSRPVRSADDPARSG